MLHHFAAVLDNLYTLHVQNISKRVIPNLFCDACINCTYTPKSYWHLPNFSQCRSIMDFELNEFNELSYRYITCGRPAAEQFLNRPTTALTKGQFTNCHDPL